MQSERAGCQLICGAADSGQGKQSLGGIVLRRDDSIWIAGKEGPDDLVNNPWGRRENMFVLPVMAAAK